MQLLHKTLWHGYCECATTALICSRLLLYALCSLDSVVVQSLSLTVLAAAEGEASYQIAADGINEYKD